MRKEEFCTMERDNFVQWKGRRGGGRRLFEQREEGGGMRNSVEWGGGV
jgi:hypothetical protein